MRGACTHINCNDKATIIVTLPNGVKREQCFTHFYWGYMENPAYSSFKVEKRDGFSQQFRRKSLDEPIQRHELN